MKYHKKKPKLNGVCLRNNLSKIKDNTNITNLDECESIGTDWNKNPKYHTFLEKTLVLSFICSKCDNEDEKIIENDESIEILKVLGLINNIEDYQNIQSCLK